jgi:hypothetical protein
MVKVGTFYLAGSHELGLLTPSRMRNKFKEKYGWNLPEDMGSSYDEATRTVEIYAPLEFMIKKNGQEEVNRLSKGRKETGHESRNSD